MTPFRRSRRTALVLVPLLLIPAIAAAQEERLVRGSVVDADGAPLSEAAIAPVGGGPGRSAVTGPSGRFALRLPASVARLTASRIGFAPETLAVTGDSVRFRLRPAPVELDPILVAADPAVSAASSRVVRALDVQLRPRESSQELLRLAPGLVIAQHAGGGKAEQIFLRGFDADHGTDVAVSVDGTPVNLVSHAHGQGYADLHFLIPEVVDRVEVRKGPYDAQDGDLATAGAVAFRIRDRIGPARVESRAGSFGTLHGLALLPLGGDIARPGGYVALAAHYSRGPFVASQGYRRLNGFARWTAPLGPSLALVASASGFDARWNASGQIPERAVARGLIGRFGSIDSTEGGTTFRYEASVGLRGAAGEGEWDLRAYGVRYRLDLFSDFTFFLVDSVEGDGIEQLDRRSIGGLQGRYTAPTRVLGLDGRTSAGLDVRADLGRVALYHQHARTRLETRVLGDLSEQRYSGWIKQDLRLAPRLRLELGLRGDLFRFGFADRLGPAPGGAEPAAGDRWLGIVSPKANLAIDLGSGTTLFANAGAGFHSNDARDVLAAPPGAAVLPRALGGELGLRRTWGAGSVAVALWGLDLGSEQVYVGDEGTTEPRGRTRRWGMDLEGRLRLARWLWLDADVNLSRGRFRDEPPDSDRIPLAPTLTSAGGLTVRELGPVSGGIRYRAVGPRAADESNTVRARGYTVAEAFGRWAIGRLELFGAVDNLFNVEWNEAQFATTSRLPGEPGPVTELHFTPGARRAAQLGVEYRF